MRRLFPLTLSFGLLLLSACSPTLSPPITGAGYPATGSGGSSDHATSTATSASDAAGATKTPAATTTHAPNTKTPTATPRPKATSTPTTGTTHKGTAQSVWETFYAAIDNDPAGSLDIAYPAPQGAHARAGGIGTYANPITLAADARWLPVGTRVYAPRWHKYYIMEDQCVECEADWSAKHFHHVDLFMPPSMKSGVLACENAATKDQTENDTIILNPDPNRPVDTTPLYTDAGGCVVAAHQY